MISGRYTYRAGFKIADERSDDEARRKRARPRNLPANHRYKVMVEREGTAAERNVRLGKEVVVLGSE
jgi:hypothetical protein